MKAPENKRPFAAHILLVSGRASFEIMQKARCRASPSCVPSSLAVDFARESNQTLGGFLRSDTMNIYAGGERIIHRPRNSR